VLLQWQQSVVKRDAPATRHVPTDGRRRGVVIGDGNIRVTNGDVELSTVLPHILTFFIGLRSHIVASTPDAFRHVDLLCTLDVLLLR
jgi:hypothetical protein